MITLITMLETTLRFVIFIGVFVLCSSFPGALLGPGVFIFESFENCDPPVTEFSLSLKQRKFNRTTDVLDVVLSSPWPLSDDIIMEVNCASKKDGGYKQGSFYMKGPLCKTLKSLAGDLFYAIANVLGSDDCPLSGDAKIKDFYIDSEKLSNQILYGKYRATIKFIIENQVKGCYLLYLNLIPKE